MKPSKVILASTSVARRRILENCGLTLTAVAPKIAESELQHRLSELAPEALALALARSKAQDVSLCHPDALIIAADQTLSCQGVIYHKAKDLHEAQSNLLKLRGKSHELYSAVVCARAGRVVFEHVDHARLLMRYFSDDFLASHLAHAPEQALNAVGGYYYEASGIQFFEEVSGDYFTIQGLPLLPLLAFLRQSDILVS